MSSFNVNVTGLWLLCLLAGYGSVNLVGALLFKQPYRTGYHFQPRKNYMNDPNGPMLYQGIYHLFYQYNPIGHGSSNGPRVWGHATSTDLVNWTIQPDTLKPQSPSNNQSSWSGSTTILPGNKPIILFTGLSPQNQQVQNVAMPKNLSDPYLKEWILLPQNPIISPTLQNKIDPSNFRDPTTAWILPDGRWRVVVGSVRGNRGIALLFRSKDFINWVQAKHPLYSYKNSGMWECPDFYPVYFDKGGQNIGVDTSTIGQNVKHVLKVSLIKTQHDVYTIGSYNIKNDAYFPPNKFVNESSSRYDYGNYYASKTFYDDSKKRRILFGWVKESIPDADCVKNGWAGIQMLVLSGGVNLCFLKCCVRLTSNFALARDLLRGTGEMMAINRVYFANDRFKQAIPRSIWLDSSGKQLIQWPVQEIETLRWSQVSLPSQVIKGGSLIEILGVTAAQADVEISFSLGNLKLEAAEKFDSKWANDPQLLCKQNGLFVKGVFGPFGLLTLGSKGLEEFTGVFFRIFNADNKPIVLMCSDQRRSSLSADPEKTIYGTYVDVDPIDKGFSLRVLIDNSVVESFGSKGKKVITARVYPTLAIGDKARLYLFNNGTHNVDHTGFSAWSMKTARIA